MVLIAAIASGFAIFLFTAYIVRIRGAQPAEARIRNLILEHQLAAAEPGSDEQRFLRRDSSSIPFLVRFLSTKEFTSRWTFDLERAGLKLRAGEYFLIRAALGVGAAAIVVLIGRSFLFFLVGLAAGVVGYMLPAFWLGLKVRGRINAIDKQLVEAVTLIAGALRSGFAFAQAMDVAADRLGPPISLEFSRVLLDINLGASTEDALRAFNQRLGSDDVDMVVTAILIQRNTGGNLAEVLDSVTETMRDRARLRGEIKTMTTQQQLTGWVLSGYPLALAALFFLISPGTTKLLWTTGPGLVLLAVWVVLNSTGIFVVRRILNIDI